MSHDEFADQVAAVSSLRDPVRRSLYKYVAEQSDDVSRDDAAHAAGVSRTLAAFHLERLVEAGLLEASYRRLSGRTGPGAGRTAKVYRRARRQFRVNLPERRYDVLAEVFAEALDSSVHEQTSERLAAAAEQFGARLGDQAASSVRGKADQGQALVEGLRLLAEFGFEPIHEGDWITLRNCPFDALVQEHRDLVCGVNLSIMNAFLKGLGSSGLEARLEPAEGRCCVRLHRAAGQLPRRRPTRRLRQR
jgi:predicted ArsR family transcriptional regulator